MLTLQRASAGSGKTYTLARRFIRSFITVKRDDGTYRLAHPRELPENLSRILAITFTNKATNEMKERIVEKLADLAFSSAPDSKVAYLKDFMEELGAQRSEVAGVARAALEVLLNEYSSFHVSTIDSFFQTVLRTFAYETDLNDSYQIEIDTDFVSKAGIDTTLDSVNAATNRDPEAEFWISRSLEEKSPNLKKWNIFQRSENSASLYSSVISLIKRLSSEEYKMVSGEVEEYFEKNPSFSSIFLLYERHFLSRLAEPFGRMQAAARRVKDLFVRAGIDFASEGQRYLVSRIGYMLKSSPDKPFKEIKQLDLTDARKLFPARSPHAKMDPAMIGPILEAAREAFGALDEWTQLLDSPEIRHWMLYCSSLPQLALIMRVSRNIREYLEANNLVQLGDTNSLLRRIIGDDDAPFIYERIGTRLSNYLIDEFQDTSRLQWENLRPLLLESESHDHDNLVIGDAKQSIYRFRNADPSLISIDVPTAFPRCAMAGTSRADNTNWRSDRTMVEFNNTLFRLLSAHLDATLHCPEEDDRLSFTGLYANTVQFPASRSRQGYVEIRTMPAKESEEEFPEWFSQFGPMVKNLLARGYRQRDIALLVRTNEMGRNVIQALADYNASLAPGEKPVEFVSEQSLSVANAPAVRTIIATLKAICRGRSATHSETYIDWREIATDFNFFALRHPELKPAEMMEAFLAENDATDAIDNMLSQMQAVALPALVEAIIANFISPAARREEAAFLAAFQDKVLEYCSRYSADVASFLKWWEKRAGAISISSPSDTDAVQVTTIHKAKGLEYKVVIIPYEDMAFEKATVREWRWVRPLLMPELEGHPLPPVIPVTPDASVLDTAHADLARSHADLVAMDALNTLYVAYTRAVDELYIFLPEPKERRGGRGVDPELTMPVILPELVEAMTTRPESAAEEEMLLPHDMPRKEPDGVIRIGQPLSPEEIAEKTRRGEHKVSITREIGEYHSSEGQKILLYTDSEAATPPDTDEDPDPRSEGNLLHALMENIATSADIPRALLRMKMKGAMTRAHLQRAEKRLREAVVAPETSRWFDGSMTVINERALLRRGSALMRPDRIMTDGKGHVVVVDYKFGDSPASASKYRGQVRRYARALLASGKFTSAEAFLWYVRAGKVEKVDL